MNHLLPIVGHLYEITTNYNTYKFIGVCVNIYKTSFPQKTFYFINILVKNDLKTLSFDIWNFELIK